MGDDPDDEQQDRPCDGKSRAGPSKEAPGGVAFELWLNHRLHQLYDGVTAEPIPPELLRLIEEDRTRQKS